MGVTQKLCYSAGFYINLSTIKFYDLFAKYRNLSQNIASKKMVAESLQSKALANGLRQPLEKREKTSVFMMEEPLISDTSNNKGIIEN